MNVGAVIQSVMVSEVLVVWKMMNGRLELVSNVSEMVEYADYLSNYYMMTFMTASKEKMSAFYPTMAILRKNIV